MGLGLVQFIPFVIYIGGIIVAYLSVFVNPVLGVLFLFPLLPYQVIFEKIYAFPLGNNLNDLVICAVIIGWYLRRSGKDKKNALKDKTHPEVFNLSLSIIFIVITSLIGLINAFYLLGLNIDTGFKFIADWKNYMLLPLVWLLTFKNIKDKKMLKFLTVILLFGILGADYYFYTNIKWMELWHFSERLRNMMSGLFVYLGANHYGAFFAHFIFIAIGLFLFDKSPKRKFALLGIIAFTGYCLIHTYSRGAYIALVAGLLFIGLIKERWILLLLIIFFIFWRSLVPISVVERIDMTKNDYGELEASAEIRIALWQDAIAKFKDSPLIGNGFNTFQVSYKGQVWRDTHNYYLKMLTELGVLGFIAFIYFLISALALALRLYRKTTDYFFKGLSLGFATCVIAVATTNFFGDRWTFLSLGSYFWVFLGIITRASIINKTENTRI
jgi:O-antigen ligase